MPYAICPECDEDIYLRNMPNVGDFVHCPSCETRLEVVGVHPLELDWPWDDDELEDTLDSQSLDEEQDSE